MTDNFEKKVAVEVSKHDRNPMWLLCGRAWLVHVFPRPGFAGRPAGTWPLAMIGWVSANLTGAERAAAVRVNPRESDPISLDTELA